MPTFCWTRPLTALATLTVLLLLVDAKWQKASAADTIRKSGYAVTDQLCGQAPRAYPKLRIGMREGYCAGLVASKEDGLIFPRSIVQIPGQRQFVIADMGSWNPGQGRLLLLDPDAPEDKRITKLIGGLDFPFGLEIGPDRKIYASTDQTIFRFDPLASDPQNTMETIIGGLPGNTTTLSDGSLIKDSAHPLKSFLFDKTGRIYVNIGAPTDSCLQLDGARRASGISSRWVRVPAGRERPRSAGSADAERGAQRHREGKALRLAVLLRSFDHQPRVQILPAVEDPVPGPVQQCPAISPAVFAAAAACGAARHAVLFRN